jgi:hypothetical protein
MGEIKPSDFELYPTRSEITPGYTRRILAEVPRNLRCRVPIRLAVFRRGPAQWATTSCSAQVNTGPRTLTGGTSSRTS